METPDQHFRRFSRIYVVGASVYKRKRASQLAESRPGTNLEFSQDTKAPGISAHYKHGASIIITNDKKRALLWILLYINLCFMHLDCCNAAITNNSPQTNDWGYKCYQFVIALHVVPIKYMFCSCIYYRRYRKLCELLFQQKENK